jgi:hypothetical protein
MRQAPHHDQSDRARAQQLLPRLPSHLQPPQTPLRTAKEPSASLLLLLLMLLCRHRNALVLNRLSVAVAAALLWLLLF